MNRSRFIVLLAAALSLAPTYGRTVGGGSGSITASAPLTGVGTVGSPLAIPAATQVDGGYLPATDKQLIDTVRAGWETKVSLFMLALSPSLTQCRTVAIPILGGTTAWPTTTNPITTGDGACEGGCTKTLAGATNYFIGPAVANSLQLGVWSITLRSKFLGGGATSHDSELGFLNGAKTHALIFGRINTSSATKYSLSLIGTSTPAALAGTVGADSNFHDVTIFGNGTSNGISVYVDEVLDISNGAESVFGAEPFYPFFESTQAGEMVVSNSYVYCGAF